VRASLADQDDEQLSRLAAAVAQALQRPDTLAIALGANLPSPAGEPPDTLLAVRPLLEHLLQRWARSPLLFRWSPLQQTAPVGGPPGQRVYSNGVLLVELPVALAGIALPEAAQPGAALQLLQGLQQLEAQFGRPPQAQRQHWGPRSLDLDLLWWGELVLDRPATAATPALQLPHPLWRQRSFVVEPLATLIPAIPGALAQDLAAERRGSLGT
jgi:2-amino-4-hydroxy-6-hydroxymethyldihydropteridine diphosphokinase